MAETNTMSSTAERGHEVKLRFDKLYFKEFGGIIRLVQLGGGLIGLICVLASGSQRQQLRGKFYKWISIIGLIITTILLVLHVFHVVEKFLKIRNLHVPWLRIQAAYCATMMFLYLMSSILLFGQSVAFTVAGVFGLVSMVAYGIDSVEKFRSFWRREPAQGGRRRSHNADTAGPAAAPRPPPPAGGTPYNPQPAGGAAYPPPPASG